MVGARCVRRTADAMSSTEEGGCPGVCAGSVETIARCAPLRGVCSVELCGLGDGAVGARCVAR